MFKPSSRCRRILAAMPGEEERLETNPAIRYLVNAAFLELMLAEYRQLAERAGAGAPQEPEDEGC